ncbi:DNA cytosine methyltransferase [Phytomonospora sp. NPDC050363]|uniref:DNA cytosine methyltransferase n=1 Tax=Phytomonospora sp. NPDC050363 TaxID=3155642 RepID=UPI0033C8F6B6
MPRLLDLYCGQGGASAGYAAAGWDVTGVDLFAQPRYPFTFVQGDALEYLAAHGSEYDAITGGPPCQAFTKAWRIQQRKHPRLIAPTRDLMTATGRPWVIENVEEARTELRHPVLLCGAMFGLRTYRHRLFETGGGFTLTPPGHPVHLAPLAKMGRPRKPGEFAHYVGNFPGVADARADMGMPWANRDGIREAIPVPYAKTIGTQLLNSIRMEVTT